MFNKTNDPAYPATTPHSAGGNSKSVLAPDLVIKGDIVSNSTIEIMGRVEGKITSNAVIVGTEGRITGSVSAESVDMRGTFDGTIATQSLALRASCDVQADILYTSLSIESGARVEGKFKLKKS
jgi:cytoskeletal protein CcmA (bactofilin family)